MAITNNGTMNLLPTKQIPSGYTRPTITTFTDWEYESTLTLSVLKATVENATASTTMTNIFDNATVGLDKQIDDILAADYLATATVTAFAKLTAIETNYTDTEATDAWLTNTAASYVCTVKLYVKTS